MQNDPAGLQAAAGDCMQIHVSARNWIWIPYLTTYKHLHDVELSKRSAAILRLGEFHGENGAGRYARNGWKTFPGDYLTLHRDVVGIPAAHPRRETVAYLLTQHWQYVEATPYIRATHNHSEAPVYPCCCHRKGCRRTSTSRSTMWTGKASDEIVLIPRDTDSVEADKLRISQW